MQYFIFSVVDFNMLCAIHNGQYFAMLMYGHFSYFSLDTPLCIVLFFAHVDLFGMMFMITYGLSLSLMRLCPFGFFFCNYRPN